MILINCDLSCWTVHWRVRSASDEVKSVTSTEEVSAGVAGWRWGVVVVVLTVCLDDVSVHATKRPAPNSGFHVPVDMTPMALHLSAEP